MKQQIFINDKFMSISSLTDSKRITSDGEWSDGVRTLTVGKAKEYLALGKQVIYGRNIFYNAFILKTGAAIKNSLDENDLIKTKLNKKLGELSKYLVQGIDEDCQTVLITNNIKYLMVEDFLNYQSKVEKYYYNQGLAQFISSAVILINNLTLDFRRVYDAISYYGMRYNKPIIKIKEQELTINEFMNKYIVPNLTSPSQYGVPDYEVIPPENYVVPDNYKKTDLLFIILAMENKINVVILNEEQEIPHSLINGTLNVFEDIRVLIEDEGDLTRIM